MRASFEFLFGLLRLGSFVKHVPAPVVAGFQNAAAILIFFSQSDTLLGFRHHVALYWIPLHWSEVQPGALLVGVATCALILNGSRLTRRVPPTILGLVGGMVIYYLLVALGFGSQVGPVIGDIPVAWPTPHYAMDFLALVHDPAFIEIMPTILAGALSLALVASLDAVLCARLVQNDSGNRVDSNRELVRLGAGNTVAACFGGIASGINLASSFANHRSGARTPLSVLLHGVAIFVSIVALSPLIGILSRVVSAGTLLCVAIQLFDRWTLQILKKLLRGEFAQLGSALRDLAVIVVVTVVAVAINIVAAVAIGVVVTVLFFLFRMSTSVIRRTVFAGLTEREVDVIKTLLARRSYQRGEAVFKEGDGGSELYIIAKGTASVRMQLPGAGRSARLMTFSAGTVFGELALLDQEARSATVESDEELLCYVLSRGSLVAMTEQEPLIAIKVLANLARGLAGRLRVANRTIFQLAT